MTNGGYGMAARWRKLSHIAVLILSSLAFVLVAQTAFAVSGSVTGKVTDFTNGQAIVGATVDLQEWDNVLGDWVTKITTVTDASGNYTVGGIVPGYYVLRASYSSVSASYAYEYNPVSFTGLEVAPVAWNPQLVPDVSLIEGTVTSGGSPVLDVPVCVYQYDAAQKSWVEAGWAPSDPINGTYKIKTSDLYDPKAWQGIYRLGVERLSADKFGTRYLGSFWGGGSTPAGGADVNIYLLTSAISGRNLVLSPMVKVIAGNIISRTLGSGLAGSTATLTDKNGDSDVFWSTDASGAFDLWADPAAGPYTFEAMCPTYIGYKETGLTWTGATRTTPVGLDLDTTPPTIVFTVVGNNTEAATLKIDVADKDLFPCTTTYSINGVGNSPYTQPLVFTVPGTYRIAVTATDSSSFQTTRSFTVTVVADATPPVLSAAVSGNGTAVVTLSASATDNSGIAPAITYSVGGSAPTVYAGPVNFTVPGTYQVVVKATDAAGNVSANQIFYVNVKAPAGAPARVAGANRYDVAVNLWRVNKAEFVYSDVIVACGEDRAMADPLGAAALASAYNCPVFLTPTSKVNANTLTAIKQMCGVNGGRINIHVVGGTASIPKTVYDALAAAKGAGTIERINGANRYDLAYRIAARTKTVLEAKGKTVPGVIVVNIENPASFNDALAASPISARGHLPLIGVKGDSVPTEAGAALALFAGKPRYALNSAYLSARVMNATGCSSAVANSKSRTIAAVDIAKWGVSNKFVTYSMIGVVNKLSDALPAGPVLGVHDGVMLYTDAAPLSPATASFLPTIKSLVYEVWVYGGTASITDPTAAAIHATLQ